MYTLSRVSTPSNTSTPSNFTRTVTSREGTSVTLGCKSEYGGDASSATAWVNAWDSKSMSGVEHGYSAQLKWSKNLSGLLKPTSERQRIALSNTSVERGDIIALVNHGTACKTKHSAEAEKNASEWCALSNASSTLCHTNASCYWDPHAVPGKQCQHIRRSCFSTHLSYGLLEDSDIMYSNQGGVWFRSMDSDNFSIPRAVHENISLTSWQCGLQFSGLVSEITCQDLCSSAGAGSTTTVNYECCANAKPCTGVDLLSLSSLKPEFTLTDSFVRQSRASLHTVSVSETLRGRAGTSVLADGSALTYYPFDRCFDDAEREMETVDFICNATAGTLTVSRMSSTTLSASNATVNDLLVALRKISQGRVFDAEILGATMVSVPATRGAGGKTHSVDRMEIHGEPMETSGSISRVIMRFTDTKFFVPDRHYLYALAKSQNGSLWTVKNKALVHTVKSTDVMTVGVEDETGGAFHIDAGDYIAMINVGWEVKHNKSCNDFQNKSTCESLSKSECSWDDATHLCGLRHEYAQLHLDSELLASYDSNVKVAGMYADESNLHMKKTPGNVSLHPLDGITSHPVGTTLSVTKFVHNARVGFQVLLEGTGRICGGGGGGAEGNSPTTRIKFTDPLDSGDQDLPQLQLSADIVSRDETAYFVESTMGRANVCPTVTTRETIKATNKAMISSTKVSVGYGGRNYDIDGAVLKVLRTQVGFAGDIKSVGGALVHVPAQELTRGFSAGTARSGGLTNNGTNDYKQVDETLTFASGELSKTFEVYIFNDQFFEFPDETFKLFLTQPTLIDAVDGTLTVDPLTLNYGLHQMMSLEIIDDGDAGMFSFSKRYFSIAEGDNTLVTITVTRTNRDFGAAATGGDIMLHYETQDRWAMSGTDYTGGDGYLNFTGQQHTTEFTLPIIQDNVFEYPDEELDIVLVDATYNGHSLGVRPLRPENGTIVAHSDLVVPSMITEFMSGFVANGASTRPYGYFSANTNDGKVSVVEFDLGLIGIDGITLAPNLTRTLTIQATAATTTSSLLYGEFGYWLTDTLQLTKVNITSMTTNSTLSMAGSFTKASKASVLGGGNECILGDRCDDCESGSQQPCSSLEHYV